MGDSVLTPSLTSIIPQRVGRQRVRPATCTKRIASVSPRKYSDAECDVIASALMPYFIRELLLEDWDISDWSPHIRTNREGKARRVGATARQSPNPTVQQSAEQFLLAQPFDRDAIIMRCLNALHSYHAWALYFEATQEGNPDLPQPVMPIQELPGDDGQTLLHLAIPLCQPDFIAYLLQQGACPRTTDASGRTPLHLHAEGFLSIRVPDHATRLIQLLLRHGAYVNSQDSQGQTPLHVAAAAGNVAACAALLAGGADPRVSDREGRLPSDRAREQHHNILALLEGHMLAEGFPEGSERQRARL
jgi:hypothetical protein